MQSVMLMCNSLISNKYLLIFFLLTGFICYYIDIIDWYHWLHTKHVFTVETDLFANWTYRAQHFAGGPYNFAKNRTRSACMEPTFNYYDGLHKPWYYLHMLNLLSSGTHFSSFTASEQGSDLWVQTVTPCYLAARWFLVLIYGVNKDAEICPTTKKKSFGGNCPRSCQKI